MAIMYNVELLELFSGICILNLQVSGGGWHILTQLLLENTHLL